MSFDPQALIDLPEPARRWLTAAIDPGTLEHGEGSMLLTVTAAWRGPDGRFSDFFLAVVDDVTFR